MKLLNDGHDPNFGCFIHNEIQLQNGLYEKGLQTPPPKALVWKNTILTTAFLFNLQ